MNKFYIIRKGDSKIIRRHKQSLRKFIKRSGTISKPDEKTAIKAYLGSRITYADYIEDFCSINNIYKWEKKNNIITLEDKFGLFQNPNQVIKTLLEMLHRAKIGSQSHRVRYKGKVSFGALYLIDNLCWEIAKKRTWQLNFQDINENEHQKLANLRSIQSSTYENTHAYMINERVKINRSLDRKADQSYKAKSKDITDMVQQAIRETSNKPDFDLSFNAYQTINSTIGEHFDNIILHAPKAEFGVLCGFYDKDVKEITILIYNFGRTIAQTLTTDSLPPEMKEDIEAIIKSHIKKEFFSLKGNFSIENALTLLALQEGISSRVVFDKTRGHGITDYIEHCFALNAGTKVVIISGNTAIRIDNKYSIENKFVLGRTRRIIALNDDNDIFTKPDSNYVINMNLNFPGVLIETTIPLI